MRFLSDEWLSALDQAARQTSPPADLQLSIEYRVGEGPEQVRYTVVFETGTVRVTTGEVDSDVRISASRAVAESVQRGERGALDGFMKGDIRVGGDLEKLMANQEALQVVGDLFLAVRSPTN